MKAKQEHGLASVTRRAAGLKEKWGHVKPSPQGESRAPP